MSQNTLFTVLLEIFTGKGTRITAILFFVCIFQNICSRVLQMAQVCFSRQELSIKHKKSFVRQFCIFGFTIGVADFLGAGGDQNSKESHHLRSSCFWRGRSPYICLPARRAQNRFFNTLMERVSHDTHTTLAFGDLI